MMKTATPLIDDTHFGDLLQLLADHVTTQALPQIHKSLFLL